MSSFFPVFLSLSSTFLLSLSSTFPHHTLVYSLTHSLMHPFTYALMHSFTHAIIQSFTHSLIHSVSHSSLHVAYCSVWREPCSNVDSHKVQRSYIHSTWLRAHRVIQSVVFGRTSFTLLSYQLNWYVISIAVTE